MLEKISRELENLLRLRLLPLFVLLAAGVLYSLLIGNLYKGATIQHIPVLVCDLDNSRESRQLVEALSTTDQYKLRGVYNEESTAQNALLNKHAEVLVVVPPDFSKRLATGQSVKLHCVVDGGNALHASYASSPMQLLDGSFAAQFRQQQAQLLGVPSLPSKAVALSTRVTQNSTQSYAAFYLYGIILAAAQFGLTLAFGSAVLQAKAERRLASSDWLSLELAYLLLTLIALLLACLCIALIWNLPLKASFFALVMLYSAFAWAVMNFAGLVALFCTGELAMTQFFALYTLPAFMLSGYIWPESAMPTLIKLLSYGLPLHYIAADFRSMALCGEAAHWGQHFWLLVAMGALLFIINLFVSRTYRCEKQLIVEPR